MFDLMKLVENEVLLLDGAMGTELIRSGLPPGHCPEAWNEEKPEAVAAIHLSYLAAGSRAILTNSFGGNGLKLAAYGLENRAYDLNFRAARIARSVCPEGCYVGGSIGPTGKFLPPVGDLTESQPAEAFRPQIEGLVAGGVDFLLIETQYDLKEALAALRAAREISSLPVLVTMTFQLTRRGYFTIMGVSPEAFVKAMKAEQVAACGANCTPTSEQMIGLIKIMHSLTEMPLLAQANAGQPQLGPDGSTFYSQCPEEYASYIPDLIKAGARIIGGCCGTTPEYIKKMAEIISALGLDILKGETDETGNK
ncbi:MAG: homocysteine S-methyltransferase family protein [Candidatus Saccharicenans sp.]|uniref:homocysteine S-methyltransferase family protein n=1 Tax=Candidatus Saccharicenans sp. TaxID=2819258 RepID=UPI004049C974